MILLRYIGLCGALLQAAWSISQPERSVHYNRLLHQASVLQAKGETPAAFMAYDSAFANIPWGLWDISEAVALALRSGDTARAINHLELLYARGGEPLITYSNDIIGLLATGTHVAALGLAREATSHWIMQADSVWIKALMEMRELDQSDRSSDPIMLRNDSINLHRLVTLTDERGYPTQTRTGACYGIVNLLFWHHRSELASSPAVQQFWAMTQAEIAAGEVPPDYLCAFLDFDDFHADRPMRYGTLLYYFHQKGDIKLIEREELNRNRASVGLETIEDFALVTDLDLDALIAK